MKSLKIALVLLSLGSSGFAAWAEEPEDFRAAMEHNNAEWLQAYNEQDAGKLGRMYTEDVRVPLLSNRYVSPYFLSPSTTEGKRKGS